MAPDSRMRVETWILMCQKSLYLNFIFKDIFQEFEVGLFLQMA
jgi:hypothetical protein